MLRLTQPRITLLVLLALLGVAHVAHAQETGSIAQDREALVALYNATAGVSWGDKTNWLSTKPLSEWYGVSTDSDGRVTEVKLGGNNLNGSIPAKLGKLSKLRWLDLQWNRLTGPIPAKLGKLSKLAILILHRNNLTGSIPAELGNLSELWGLALSHNDLTGKIPTSLGKLSKLQGYLELQGNDLRGKLPAALSSLKNLEKLYVGFNARLSGSLPSGPWAGLTELDLFGTTVCVPASLQARLATVKFTSSGRTCGGTPSAVTEITLAIFYTAAARTAVGNKAQIEANIDKWVAVTNQAYADSGVQQRIALVARQEVTYTESGSPGLDLGRLEHPSDGHLDEVHTIRDEVGADLVHLVIGTARGACGITPSGGKGADKAFGVIRATHCDDLVLAHELGHNMGLSHDRYSLCSSRPDLFCESYYPYSYGYVNQQASKDEDKESTRWHTIMSYALQCFEGFEERMVCHEIPRFSDPKMTWEGDPLGVAGDRDAPGVDGPADAVRALNNTRHSVAAFRPPTPRFPVTETGRRRVAENTPPQENIGDPVTATRGQDVLTYSLGGTDAAAFAIDTSTGQLQTKAPLDHDTKSRYAVTVSVHDGTPDATIDDTIAVTIIVIDLDGLPPVPPTPTLSSTPGVLPMTLTVRWQTPDNPPDRLISGYQVQIKGDESWTPPDPPTETGLSKTFTNVKPGPAYTARVRAVNAAGESAWALSGSVKAPSIIDSIPELTFLVNYKAHMDLSLYITGDGLSYAAKSSDTEVATISVNGARAVVTGVAQGSAIITVTAANAGGSAELTFRFTVTTSSPPLQPRTRIPFRRGSISALDMTVGTSQTVTVSSAFTGSGLSYTAKSSDTRVATVSVSGADVTVTGVTQGSAIITVTATNTAGSAEQTFDVTVRGAPPPPIAAGRISALDMTVGTSQTVTVSSAFTGSGLSYTAESSHTGVATVSVSGADVTVTGVTRGSAIVTVTATNAGGSVKQRFTVTVSGGSGGGGSGGGGSGGGGGGGGGRRRPPPADTHGNTPATATALTLRSQTPRTTRTGHLVSATDVDYFRLDVPRAVVLTVETTGATNTRGRLASTETETVLAEDDTGGTGNNFRFSLPVAAGSYDLAVQGSGGATGPYTLVTTLVVGHVDNPGGRHSFQSGLGVVSGWVCDAETVEIAFETEQGPVHRFEAAYGTERADTRADCGDSDNGFGLLLNWNLLGDGEHTVVVVMDGVEWQRTAVTVTTVGEGEEQEFLKGVPGACVVADFPTARQTVRLVWQEANQNFLLARGNAPQGAHRAGVAGESHLDNPAANSFQSGLGVISGWVCDAEAVEIVFETEQGAVHRFEAAYGTERLDTLGGCGDSDNGFGLLFNWNLLGDGVHTVVAAADGEEFGRAVVRVTTLGAEFVEDVTGECVVEDFPRLGERVTLEWQQSSQNFAITWVE